MTPYASLTAPILAAKLPKSKKVFDNAKVTDHHAIIPTGQSPQQLMGNERLMYHLIAQRFIAAFYPDCEFLQTTVIGAAGTTDFKASGKVIASQGWRAVFASNNADKQQDASSEDKILPPFTVGESGPHEPSLLKKTTQPPKYYTEGTLLRAMESAGKTVDDEELREAMKENGIGRPSTRAAIIETLFRRGYIYRQRKNIMASQAGIDLIATINEELLKSAKLTGIWENKLRRIERGDYSAAEFIGELKQQISDIVLAVLSDNSQRKIVVQTDTNASKNSSKGSQTDANASKNSAKGSSASSDGASATDKPKAPAKKRAPAVKSLEQIACPVCGKGHLVKGRTAYGCSEYRAGCRLLLPFDQYPADLTPAKLNTLLKKTFKNQ